MGAVNEALLFSNTGEIEVLPALPADWKAGSIQGLMARTRAEVRDLSWNLTSNILCVTLISAADDNEIKFKAGIPWTKAMVNGKEAAVLEDGNDKYILLMLNSGTEVTIEFTLSDR